MNEPLTWTHFGYLIALIAAWSLVIIATARWTVNAGMKGVTGKFEEIAKKLEVHGEKQQTLERDVLEMKADLPLCYVRREDFIRQEVMILTKLDRLRDLISAGNKSKEIEG
jgi:hypothetical protein